MIKGLKTSFGQLQYVAIYNFKKETAPPWEYFKLRIALKKL
jgi:hypothetical protein